MGNNRIHRRFRSERNLWYSFSASWICLWCYLFWWPWLLVGDPWGCCGRCMQHRATSSRHWCRNCLTWGKCHGYHSDIVVVGKAFSKSSLLGSRARVVRNAMVGWMTGWARLITNSISSNNWRKRSTWSSGRSLVWRLVWIFPQEIPPQLHQYICSYIFCLSYVSEVYVHAKVSVLLAALGRHCAVDWFEVCDHRCYFLWVFVGDF